VNQRERILAIGLGTVVGGWFLFSFIQRRMIEPLRARDGQIIALLSQIQNKENELKDAQKGALELSGWRKTSLPADESVAQTLYLDFIRKLLSESGIDRPTLRPGRSVERANVFSRLPVTVDARTDLAKLTSFLKSFENAPLLHQIRRLRIQPVLKENKIEAYDLSLSLEAVAMPDSFIKDALPTVESVGDAAVRGPDRQEHEFKVFAEKNPFQPTAVTSASTQNKKDDKAAASNDERDAYYLRAILFVEGEGVVWFVKQGEETKKVIRQGEVLDVGGFRGQAISIDPDSVRLQVDDGIGSVGLGKNLASWKKKETIRKEDSASSSENEKTSESGPAVVTPTPSEPAESAAPAAQKDPAPVDPPANSTESPKPPS
jgi:cell division septation protein DedD